MEGLNESGLKRILAMFTLNFPAYRNFKVRVGSTLLETFGQKQGLCQDSVLSVNTLCMKHQQNREYFKSF